MVCYTGAEAKEKLKGVPVEVEYDVPDPSKYKEFRNIALITLAIIGLYIWFELDPNKINKR